MHDLTAALDEHPDRATPLQLVQAEVAAEQSPVPDLQKPAPGNEDEGGAGEQLPPGAVLVPFRDTMIAVLHDSEWPSSANEDMMLALYTRWASKAFARDIDLDVWLDADPTNAEVAQFLADWGAVTGRNPKAQRRRSNGPRHTRRN